MNKVGDSEVMRGNYETTVKVTTKKVVTPTILVRKSEWTGTVHIKPGFGRRGGHARRTRVSWQVWVDGKFHSKRPSYAAACRWAQMLADMTMLYDGKTVRVLQRFEGGRVELLVDGVHVETDPMDPAYGAASADDVARNASVLSRIMG